MSKDEDPFLLIRGGFAKRKVLLPQFSPGRDEVSMFLLAGGGLTAVPASFLAKGRHTETYLLTLSGEEEVQNHINQVVYHSLIFQIVFIKML